MDDEQKHVFASLSIIYLPSYMLTAVKPPKPSPLHFNPLHIMSSG